MLLAYPRHRQAIATLVFAFLVFVNAELKDCFSEHGGKHSRLFQCPQAGPDDCQYSTNRRSQAARNVGGVTNNCPSEKNSSS